MVSIFRNTGVMTVLLLIYSSVTQIRKVLCANLDEGRMFILGRVWRKAASLVTSNCSQHKTGGLVFLRKITHINMSLVLCMALLL